MISYAYLCNLYVHAITNDRPFRLLLYKLRPSGERPHKSPITEYGPWALHPLRIDLPRPIKHLNIWARRNLNPDHGPRFGKVTVDVAGDRRGLAGDQSGIDLATFSKKKLSLCKSKPLLQWSAPRGRRIRSPVEQVVASSSIL